MTIKTEAEIVAEFMARKAARKAKDAKNESRYNHFKALSSKEHKKHCYDKKVEMLKEIKGQAAENFVTVKATIENDLVVARKVKEGRLIKSGHVNDYVKPAYAAANKQDCVTKTGAFVAKLTKTESNDFSPVRKLPEVENFYKGETKQGCDSRHYQHANYVDTAKKQPTINGRIFGEKLVVQRTDIKNQSAKDEAIAVTKAVEAAKRNG